MIIIVRIVVLFGYVVVSVETNKFYCPTDNPCILLDMDAVFILSKHDKNGTQVSPVFDLQKAEVNETSCRCSPTFSTVSLQLFPSGDSLRITFNSSLIPFRANPVDMKLDLTFDPKSHFQSGNSTLVNIQSSLMYIGKRLESFACKTTEVLTFNSDPMYRMTMEIMNLKVQAFGVTGGKFSKAEVCPYDTSTSTTTQTITTETTQHTMTSHQPTTSHSHKTNTMTTATTEPTTSHMTTGTTTSAPITQMPSTPKYDVCNGLECCIIMIGNFMFHIEYEDSDNETRMAEVKIPENATVTGNCNSVNTTQDITLHFANGWKFTVEIGDNATDDKAAALHGHTFSWQQYSLTYVMDEHFISPNTPGAVKTIMGKPMFDKFAADEQGSYICKASQTLDLGSDNSALILSDLQYRAFGTTNSTTFPDNDLTRCQADQPSTIMPNPTTPTQAPSHAVTIVGAVVGTLAFLVVVALAIMYMKKRSTMKKAQAYGDDDFESGSDFIGVR